MILIFPFDFSSFDSNKSTKGASKLRRDLINGEIANLRDLLPLPSSTRQRLSQLQLMALVCVYVRKANYFQQGKSNLIHHLYLSLLLCALSLQICHWRLKFTLAKARFMNSRNLLLRNYLPQQAADLPLKQIQV
jgi:hypothetical protein